MEFSTKRGWFMEFQSVKAEDKEKITKYLKQINARSCDMVFASIYLWRNHYRMEFTEIEDMIVFRSNEEGSSFSFPIGGADPKRAIEALKKYCEETGQKLKFHSVSRKAEEYLEENFPEQFTITFDRDLADYVYDTKALMELKGKKYHGKKNHINKFKKMYDWVYEPITAENTEDCLKMLEVWKRQNCEPEDIEKHVEICVSEHALTEREFLELKGGLIRAEGQVVAFSLGEKITEDTFVVHIEKAFSEVQGAYPLMNQEFLLHEAGDCTYVNREEDVGNPGLRKAKLSYHPVFLVEKGTAVLR